MLTSIWYVPTWLGRPVAHWGSGPMPAPPSCGIGPRNAWLPHSTSTPTQAWLLPLWLWSRPLVREKLQTQKGKEVGSDHRLQGKPPHLCGAVVKRRWEEDVGAVRLEQLEQSRGRERERWGRMPTAPREHHKMVLRLLDHLIQQLQSVALDPFCCPFWQPGNELFQHHCVNDVISITFLSQQSVMIGIPELLGKCKHASGSSCMPILVSIMWGMPVTTAGAASAIPASWIKLQSTCRSSYCTWTSTWKHVSSSVHRVVRAWYLFCWMLVRAWMGNERGVNSMSAFCLHSAPFFI